jgi:hypothetical protein
MVNLLRKIEIHLFKPKKVCQKNNNDKGLKFDCGDQESVEFAYDGTALTLTYKSDKSPDGQLR